MSDPVAVVKGERLAEYPKSLHVPPEAMRVLLESFDGPLDLLHYLIKRDDIDILDIPMAELTRQYLEYVDRIVSENMELAADYLLMSATLIEIKSRMLLPQPDSEGQEEEDPRAQLVERLLVYGKIRAAAEALRARPFTGRDQWAASSALPARRAVRPRISRQAVKLAMLGVMDRQAAAKDLVFATDDFTTQEAMAHFMICLRKSHRWLLSRVVGETKATKGRIGTFFQAALHLAKEQLVRLEQKDDRDLDVIKNDSEDKP